VALRKSSKVAWEDILDTPFIYDAMGNVTGVYQVAQPLSGVWIDFVVISGHSYSRQPRSPPGWFDS
jgi:hypothetical protein